MSIENGVLVGIDQRELYFHAPAGRSAVYLPDSRDLWEVIWENRDQVLGFAHSHPGSGVPSPSGIDIETFEAIEQGLGRSLIWWICSETDIVVCRRVGSSPKWHTVPFDGSDLSWLPKLREHSYEKKNLRSYIVGEKVDPRRPVSEEFIQELGTGTWKRSSFRCLRSQTSTSRNTDYMEGLVLHEEKLVAIKKSIASMRRLRKYLEDSAIEKENRDLQA